MSDGAIILFGIVVPERVSMSLEFCVALMLILLGFLNLQRLTRYYKATSLSRNIARACSLSAENAHGLAHLHVPEEYAGMGNIGWTTLVNRQVGKSDFYVRVRTIIVGIVHGLAGSAAVALLVLPLIRKPVWAMLCLFIFGAGTIAAVMLITAMIAVPITYAANRVQRFGRYVGAAAGALSVTTGLFLVRQIGFVDGLFR